MNIKKRYKQVDNLMAFKITLDEDSPLYYSIKHKKECQFMYQMKSRNKMICNFLVLKNEKDDHYLTIEKIYYRFSSKEEYSKYLVLVLDEIIKFLDKNYLAVENYIFNVDYYRLYRGGKFISKERADSARNYF